MSSTTVTLAPKKWHRSVTATTYARCPSAGLQMGTRLRGLVGTRTEQICLSRASEQAWVRYERAFVEPSAGCPRAWLRRENCPPLDYGWSHPSTTHGHGLSLRGAGYRDGATETLQERSPAQHAHAAWAIQLVATIRGGPPDDRLTLRIDERRRDHNTRLRCPGKDRATGAVRSLLRVSVRQVGRALPCAQAHHLMDRIDLMHGPDPMSGFVPEFRSRPTAMVNPTQPREFARA